MASQYDRMRDPPEYGMKPTRTLEDAGITLPVLLLALSGLGVALLPLFLL